MPTPKQGEATVEIEAAPARVYDLLSDITRMGEWSPECYRCEWIGEVQEPVAGARFRGHNKMGPLKWSTTCEVVKADRGREFAFTVLYGDDDRESTRWRYTFTPSGSGTTVRESFQFVWCPLPSRIGEFFLPRGRVLRQGLGKTLARIKTRAEAEAARAPEDSPLSP